MIVLESTQTLTLVLAAPVAVEASVLASFRAIGPASSSYTPGTETTVSAGTTPVAVVTPPVSGQKVLDLITVRNLDTTSIRATLALGPSTLWTGVLQPSENLSYVAGVGWQKTDAEGRVTS
jgi:hypothetical protein